MDYAALLTEISKPSYAGLSDGEIAEKLNAMMVPGPAADVSAADVSAYLLLGGEFFTVEAFAAGAPTGDAAHDGALLAAKSLVAILSLPQPPAFQMSNPAVAAKVQAMVGALLAQETAVPNSTGMTQALHDGLLALAQPLVPWPQTIGFGVLDHGDILVARGETWESKAIPNYPVASAAWDASTVTVKTVDPHPFTVGSDLNLIYSAFIPKEYDGTRMSHVVDSVTVTYPMATAPDDFAKLTGDPVTDAKISGKSAKSPAPGAPVGSVTDGVKR